MSLPVLFSGWNLLRVIVCKQNPSRIDGGVGVALRQKTGRRRCHSS